jgi:cytochrome c oxidase cbb3-type subunit 3
MPHWNPRLSDDQIHVLAAYVYHWSHPTNDDEQ